MNGKSKVLAGRGLNSLLSNYFMFYDYAFCFIVKKVLFRTRIILAMAYALLHPFLFFFTFFLPHSVVAQNNGTVFVGSSLIAADNSRPWLSPSGDFAFGFQKLQESNLFLLCIYYYKIPDATIVWYGNEGNPVASGSKVELTADNGLVLTDPQGKELQISDSILNDVSFGFMNDTGNFVLVRRDSFLLWESFKYPTDTVLPSQIIEIGGELHSRWRASNFSKGRFLLRLRETGDLVLNTRNMESDYRYEPYYVSGFSDPLNSTNSGYQVVLDETGYMYILRNNGQRFDLTPGGQLRPENYYFRATLDFDGVFTLYYRSKASTGNPNWTTVWSLPDNICVRSNGELGSGACGYNSVCTLGDDNRPKCECPQGYSFLDPDDTYSSCKPNFTPSCDENQLSSAGNLYDFVELTNTDWPQSDFELIQPCDEEDCRSYCLNDCFCAVAILRNNSCYKKRLPLSNGRKDNGMKGRALLKVGKYDAPLQNAGERKDQSTLIIVGSVLLGSSVFVNFIFVCSACLGFFQFYHKKVIRINRADSDVETNLRFFTYKELAEATSGFNEELGKGAFGTVYKGVMQTSSKYAVAVKKLVRVAQDGEKEFRTEVNVIAQTHHKNLVRLIGFCDEGVHRLLVYEYMSNGTLASFLFGETKPSWKQRTHIALGIARGLAYLHEECNTQIIHCDIKPQNILLDDYHNPRISDFGLAKLLMMNQSQTHTAIRGTKGYVAPEWFRSTPITAKVDVYSFGVLLIEIISCRRSLEDLETGGYEKLILTDWAWDCYQEGKMSALVENDEEALNDWKKLERFLTVAIWCVQENPSLRPTMRQVTQMLEGVMEVAKPSCPSPFSSTG